MDKKEPASETKYFELEQNEHGKKWLLYNPIKNEPGKYSCWEPITEEFWAEFEKLQKAQEEITRLKAELERERELRKDAWNVAIDECIKEMKKRIKNWNIDDKSHVADELESLKAKN